MLQDIFIGNAPNDKTGTPARQAGQIINANFTYLNSRITSIQSPDAVLKRGNIETSILNVHVDADAFEWRIAQVEFLDNPVYDIVLDAATDGYYRKDVLLGNNTGGYNIFKGDEDPTSATEPNLFPNGTIKLGVIDVYGAVITGSNVDGNDIIQYLMLKHVAKGVGNGVLDKEEPGDIFEGWKDATTYWTRAIWNGGDRSDRANYTPIVEVEI
ncbi:hypothetical protein [Flavobacterium sp. FlaQc-28]|uniref:hypothetical protein n=1 Tax=Flavobacterium sp. FlaQc-28 TaxID=3374178 RepID=UPI00375730AF